MIPNAPNPDREGKYIVSTRIRVGRNVDNMPLGPAISKIQRDEVESSVVDGLYTLEGELAGHYYPPARYVKRGSGQFDQRSLLV